jgi:hypothetical protein
MQHHIVRSGLPLHSKKASAEVDTFAIQYTSESLLPPPHANASSSEKVYFLHQQLDSLGVDAEILPGLRLLGSGGKERLQGGALQSL